MRSVVAILFLAASAVVAIPAEKTADAAAPAASVNEAANNGAKGIDAAANAALAEALAEAGDLGAVTTGAAFEAATAKIAKQPNSTLLTLLAPPEETTAAAADAGNGNDQGKG
ncbi:hypothetical protein GE09DRAFT_537450 [Coniochaeta sp. 2T2.1]|nr:hypothetical protein GE09DRAFT_537450 [Coniochaeta sp. 2T2.1]